VAVHAGRVDVLPAGIEEYVESVTVFTHSAADFALALVHAGREEDYERLAPPVRASAWGVAGEALARHEWKRAAELFEAIGAPFYANEARVLEERTAGAASA